MKILAMAMAISNLLNMIWNGDEWGITEDATQQLLEAEELPKESGAQRSRRDEPRLEQAPGAGV